MKRTMKLITLVVGGQNLHYQITLDLHDAMELVHRFKAEKAITNLEALGGPKLVLVDWKKVAFVEFSEIDIDDDSALTEDFRR